MPVRTEWKNGNSGFCQKQLDALATGIFELESESAYQDVTPETSYSLLDRIKDETQDYRPADCVDWYDDDDVNSAVAVAIEISDWCKNFFKEYEHLIAEI